MNTTTNTVVVVMTAAVGGALVVEAFTGLPLLFSLALVIGGVALAFAVTVAAAALLSPARPPVTTRRRPGIRAAA